MRIGILTLPLAFNYGGILQAYALQKVLNQMGHDAIHIYQPFERINPGLKEYIRRVVKMMLGKYHGYILHERKLNEWMPEMIKYTKPFIENNLNLTYPVKDPSEISSDMFDAIVVGSDQIWRPIYYQKPAQRAFLDFAVDWNVKRISYAASFGTDTWEYSDSETSDCQMLAAKFDAISVRENGAVKLCREKLKVDATIVLDPTMLLDRKDYIGLINKSPFCKSDGSLFCYVLDNTPFKQQVVEYYKNKLSLKPFRVNSYEGPLRCPIEERIAKPVEMWLRGFWDSDFIITDSFHACVFSIIFKKPFVVVLNKSRGISRFETLLGCLGLNDRIVDSINDCEVLSSGIDYDSVYEKMQILKDKSFKYLYDALS